MSPQSDLDPLFVMAGRVSAIVKPEAQNFDAKQMNLRESASVRTAEEGRLGMMQSRVATA